MPEVNPVVPDALELTFDDIANVPVSDASSVSDWNTFFDLPTNGSPFTSVEVVGNMVRLIGGSGIELSSYLFFENIYIRKVVDNINCIVGIKNNCFFNSHCTEFHLPAMTYIEFNGFRDNGLCGKYYLPSCTDLGGSVFQDNVFLISTPREIELTIPIALMTCNDGSPDDDIQELQATNTVTIITV